MPGTVPGVSIPGPASLTLPRRRHSAARLVLRALLAVPVLSVLAALGMALLLAAGPVEVTWLAHAVTPLPLGGPRAEAARLQIGRAWLGWDGFRAGAGASVVLRLEDVGIRRPDGTLLDQAREARIGLVSAALFRGVLSVERIDASGVRLQLRRDAQHGFSLGLLPPGRAGRGGGSGPALRWRALAGVRIADLRVSVQDLVLGQDWGADDVALDGRPATTASHGIVGRIEATLVLAGSRMRLHGAGVAVAPGAGPARPGGDVAWQLALDPVVPSELARASPMLAPLRALALPVAPALEVRFVDRPGRFMEPVAATVTARLGAGVVTADGSRLLVSSGQLRAQASLPQGPGAAVTLQVQEADLQLRAIGDADQAMATGPKLHAEGTLSVDGLVRARRIRGRLALDIPRIGFAGLAQYWPLAVAAGARGWITGNITEGVATALHVESTLASDAGWAQLVETGRSGGFDATGLTLWWLRPVPPLRQMTAHMSFDGSDAVLVAVSHAVLPVTDPPDGRSLDIAGGSMRITGLTTPVQVGTVSVRLSGGLGDLLAELAHPRLHLLSAHPVPFGHPSGQVQNAFTVRLPLDDHVTMDQIQVQATAQMRDVHLGDVAVGRALEHGDLAVGASADGLAVDGTGEIGGIPARLHYAMDFRAGPPSQLVEQAHVAGIVTIDALAREGLDPTRNVAGSGALTVDYAARRDGAAQVSLGLDLTGLAISTPVWSKPAGRPASASAVIGLRAGRLASIERIEASAPGLAISARAEIGDARARRIVVSHFAVGRSSGAGRLDLPPPVRPGTAPGMPRRPLRIVMQGPVLDLSAAMGGVAPAALPARRGRPPTMAATLASAGRAEPVPWQADLAFGRVLMGRQAALAGVRAHLEDDGVRIETAQLAAAGPTAVSVQLLPEAGGRRLGVDIADGGALLRGLDVTDALSGGAVRIDGRYDDGDPGHPLRAVATVDRFVVLDAPLAARIVRDLSVYGWLTALPTPQLGVDRVVLPFVLSDGVGTLDGAHANSAALGVTVRGRVDLDRRTLDLKGTVVPAWAVNRLPGRLPVVGSLFSPEKEGGMLAVALTLRGPFDDPRLQVNPLSALLPGALRTLLFP